LFAQPRLRRGWAFWTVKILRILVVNEADFGIILPNLIHKSKKRNLTYELPAACGGGQKNPDGSRAKNFLPFRSLSPLHFLHIALIVNLALVENTDLLLLKCNC
jgi:hypothetical protein